MSTTHASRRKFMVALGLGAAVAAAALKKQPQKNAERKTADDQTNDKGYQLTEHVREYYRTARV